MRSSRRFRAKAKYTARQGRNQIVKSKPKIEDEDEDEKEKILAETANPVNSVEIDETQRVYPQISRMDANFLLLADRQMKRRYTGQNEQNFLTGRLKRPIAIQTVALHLH
jgi:hypothetical protein